MKHLKNVTIAAALSVAALIGLSACQSADDHHDHSGHSHAQSGVKPYPLKTCIVTDEAFDHGKPYSFVYNGQEIKMCCDGCRSDFDKDPEKYLKKITSR